MTTEKTLPNTTDTREFPAVPREIRDRLRAIEGRITEILQRPENLIKFALEEPVQLDVLLDNEASLVDLPDFDKIFAPETRDTRYKRLSDEALEILPEIGFNLGSSKDNVVRAYCPIASWHSKEQKHIITVERVNYQNIGKQRTEYIVRAFVHRDYAERLSERYTFYGLVSKITNESANDLRERIQKNPLFPVELSPEVVAYHFYSFIQEKSTIEKLNKVLNEPTVLELATKSLLESGIEFPESVIDSLTKALKRLKSNVYQFVSSGFHPVPNNEYAKILVLDSKWPKPPTLIWLPRSVAPNLR